MNKKFSISIDEDIFNNIEKVRKVKRQSRSQFIKECILKGITLKEADESF